MANIMRAQQRDRVPKRLNEPLNAPSLCMPMAHGSMTDIQPPTERSAMSLPRASTKHDEGFTLIELLIVITVLGILAGIVLVAVGSTRKDSIANSCKTNFRSIELS